MLKSVALAVDVTQQCFIFFVHAGVGGGCTTDISSRK